MIEIKVKKKNGMYVGFTYSGHADFNDYGLDIVCSAVTAQLMMIYNGLEEILNIPLDMKMDNDGGFFQFSLENNEESIKKAQDLMATLNLGLKAIKSQYNDNIKLIEEEV